MTNWPDGASSAAPLPDQKDPGPAPESAPPSTQRPLANDRDTVARRIGVLIGVLLALIAVVGVVAGVALVRSTDTAARTATGYAPAESANASAAATMQTARAALLDYAVSGKTSALAPYRSAPRQVVALLAAARRALERIGDHDLDTELTAQDGAARAWFAAVGTPSTRKQARRTSQSAAARNQFAAFVRANNGVSTGIDNARARSRAQIANQHTFAVYFFPGLAVLVALAGLLAYWRARTVARPLSAVWHTVRRLDAGELSARADEFKGPVEVRDTAAAVNNLAVERRRAVAGQAADSHLRR